MIDALGARQRPSRASACSACGRTPPRSPPANQSHARRQLPAHEVGADRQPLGDGRLRESRRGFLDYLPLSVAPRRRRAQYRNQRGRVRRDAGERHPPSMRCGVVCGPSTSACRKAIWPMPPTRSGCPSGGSRPTRRRRRSRRVSTTSSPAACWNGRRAHSSSGSAPATVTKTTPRRAPTCRTCSNPRRSRRTSSRKRSGSYDFTYGAFPNTDVPGSTPAVAGAPAVPKTAAIAADEPAAT